MQNMTGYRRAAVELHGLDEEDLQWVLGNLADRDRTVLVQCLQELKELGFDGSVRLLDAKADTKLRKTATTPFERMHNATAAEMFAILGHEPSSLVAQVMALHVWRWNDAFLQMFPAVRRERIRSTVSRTAKMAPALKDYLVETISARLDSNDDVLAFPATAQVWRRVSMDSVRQLISSLMQMAALWKR